MAKSKKGVVPPQLRKHLFTKKSGGKSGAAKTGGKKAMPAFLKKKLGK